MFKKKALIVISGVLFLGGCYEKPNKETTAMIISKKLVSIQKQSALSSSSKEDEKMSLFYKKLTKKISNVLILTWDVLIYYLEDSENAKLAEATKEMQSLGFFLINVNQAVSEVGEQSRGSWAIVDYKKNLEVELIREQRVTEGINKNVGLFVKDKKSGIQQKKQIIKNYVDSLVQAAERTMSFE